MIPYVEPSPLWPLPFWYTQIISRSNSPRASPEWLQEVEVDGRRRMFANILMSKTTTDNEGRVNAVTYFTEEQIAAMYVSFSGIASIVNAEFEVCVEELACSSHFFFLLIFLKRLHCLML